MLQYGARDPSFEEKHYIEGITRKKINDNFEYYYIKNNKPVTQADLNRINKLKLPPAWTDVWISKDPNSPIQAVGVDYEGRKQYKYHQHHIEEAEKRKFLRLYNFILAMPKLEKIMKKHVKLRPYDKDRVIVSMLTLIRELHLRVGKEVYARKHKSYGVSSLRKRHVKIIGNTVFLRFKGKSGQRLAYSIEDSVLATHLKLLMKLTGDKLFQYIDDNDKIRSVTDTDLNHYIQKYMGNEYTAKDFRTYSSNYYFVRTLLRQTKKQLPTNPKIIKRNILNAIKSVVHYLRHTRAVSKKSYIMSFTVDLYQNSPEYFIKRKDDDADEVLLDILNMYKKNLLNAK